MVCVLLGTYCYTSIFTLSSVIIFSVFLPQAFKTYWVRCRKICLDSHRHFHSVNKVLEKKTSSMCVYFQPFFPVGVKILVSHNEDPWSNIYYDVWKTAQTLQNHIVHKSTA